MSKAKILEELARRAESGADSLAMDFASRMQRAKEQGEPFRTSYMHNTEKNPFKKSQGQFAMDVEPAGQYFTPLESSPTWDLGENFISGEKSFDNPLFVDFGDSYESSANWKRQLSERYGGKKGKALTNAIRKDGYDSIFTVDANGELSEAVDLYKGKGGVDMADMGAGLAATGGLASVLPGERAAGTIKASRYPALGDIATVLRKVETPIGYPFGGLADYLNKVEFNEERNVFDRLGAIPAPFEFSKVF